MRLPDGRWQARWLFTGSGSPLDGGVLHVEQGRIAGIGPRSASTPRDLGEVAILPGLVNAHTHLEFSALRTPLSPSLPFTAWLRALIARRRSASDDPAAATATGLAESSAAGIAIVGDIVTGAWQPPRLSPGMRLVAFRELLGLRPEQAESQLLAARAHLAAPGGVTCGLSPHAPYSVHPDLVVALVELAAEARAPVAMHLAETREELELLARGTGDFVDFLRELNVWQPTAIPRGTRILDYLRVLARAPRGLVIHGNYLTPEEQDFLATQPQLSVVYCPRTHAYFEHEPHPWTSLLERGVRVALGTDSRGSNPDLELWREVQHLASLAPDLHGETLLRLATRSGAEALGRDDISGRLMVGAAADVTLLRLPSNPPSDPWAALVHRATHTVVLPEIVAGN